MTTDKSDSSKRTRPARILLVDDHPLVRERLSEVIAEEGDLKVCGEAESRTQALEVMRATRPDLMIVDLSLKDGHGLELIKDVHATAPATRMLVVSMHEESVFAERCVRAGAHGYITKQEATRNVVAAIRKVLAGDIFLNEPVAQKVLGQASGKPAPRVPAGPVENLSDREVEVLELIGQGLTTRQIAEHLHLAEKTVETYRERLKVKLALADASALLQYAIQWARSRG